MNPITSVAPNPILDELKNLITYSIAHPNVELSNFQTMHRSLLKRYFEAKNVKINYEEQTVAMQIPVGKDQYTSITFECQDLERFLKACLRKDEKSLTFYQGLLSHYKVTHAA